MIASGPSVKTSGTMPRRASTIQIATSARHTIASTTSCAGRKVRAVMNAPMIAQPRTSSGIGTRCCGGPSGRACKRSANVTPRSAPTKPAAAKKNAPRSVAITIYLLFRLREIICRKGAENHDEKRGQHEHCHREDHLDRQLRRVLFHEHDAVIAHVFGQFV